MRIVGGKHKRRALQTPRDRAIRPTSDRAREAIFNLLAHGPAVAQTGFSIDGSTVLDAFCGTGALGLEALSRGAAAATFLDSDQAALDLARANAEALGETLHARFLRVDASDPPPAPSAHSLVLLDPPYGKGLARPALTALAAEGWFAPGAIIVLEQATGEDMEAPPGVTLIEQRRYGAADLVILSFGAASPDE